MEAASLSALYKLVLYGGDLGERQKFLASLVARLRSGDSAEREAMVGALSVLNLKVYGGGLLLVLSRDVVLMHTADVPADNHSCALRPRPIYLPPCPALYVPIIPTFSAPAIHYACTCPCHAHLPACLLPCHINLPLLLPWLRASPLLLVLTFTRAICTHPFFIHHLYNSYVSIACVTLTCFRATIIFMPQCRRNAAGSRRPHPHRGHRVC